ncbi:ChaC-like protein [Viridothelium virens]|uniref:glutathione-specific gamma-glutamylcyclotransferase n=1 Tax=Viridothelium virens TaxID=1048519 RepID=A0A6A6HAC1_VIRVR|nr:ChaC-like protein [Viridothelium virens]
MEFPPGFSQNFWLFGYGSLIWKPPPHFDKRVPGYIEGYVRRFWQLRWYSEDHRGTPEAPGRVVTLIERSHWESLTDHHNSTPPKVWGAAYHIPPEHVDEVRSYLDIREINGYSIQFTPIHPSPELIKSSTECTDPKPHISSAGSEPINCLVYIGLPNNPQFLGPQDPQALAEHIVRSKGPSGENKVYLYMLDDALNELSLDSGDEHVSDLARRCRKLDPEGMEGKATGHEGFKDE